MENAWSSKEDEGGNTKKEDLKRGSLKHWIHQKGKKDEDQEK